MKQRASALLGVARQSQDSASAAPEASVRGPGTTGTLSRKEQFLAVPCFFTAPEHIPPSAEPQESLQVHAERATGVAFLACWPQCCLSPPCFPALAGPEPARGLWPRGDHPHQCCRLPHPVSGPVTAGGRARVELGTQAQQEQDLEKRKRQVCRCPPGTQEAVFHLSTDFLCTILY